MAEAQKQTAAGAAATTSASQSNLIDQAIAITEQQGVATNDAKQMFQTLIESALEGTVTWGKNIPRTIQHGIATIDAAISKQLNAIMHRPEFQKLEGSWRGLHHLVFHSETSTTLKIKVLNVSKTELYRDLDTAVDFDMSHLFHKVYEDEFGTPGGEPIGTMIGDFEFTNHPEDIDMLAKVAGVAAAAHCPFVSAAGPELLGMKSFEEMPKRRELSNTFDTAPYAKWRSFRDSEDSRYVSLVMPRVLARLPYGSATKHVAEFNYEEAPLDREGNALSVPHNEYCWMNAAYAYGAVLTHAFSTTGWCTAIRGSEDGIVEDLPVHLFNSEEGDTKVKCPTEVEITDRRDAELSSLGFLALCHYKRKDYSVFFSGQTCQKPKKYDKPAASRNAEISARLPYIMASSRIAHYLKMMGRDMLGTFKEAADCEKHLNEWLAQYVLADDHPSEENKKKFPLKEAKVEVSEIPGRSGAFHAVARLRPWIQMEELTVAMSMVADIPKMP